MTADARPKWSLARKIAQLVLGFFGGLLTLAGVLVFTLQFDSGSTAAFIAAVFIPLYIGTIIALFVGRRAYAAVGMILALLIPLLLLGACFLALAGMS